MKLRWALVIAAGSVAAGIAILAFAAVESVFSLGTPLDITVVNEDTKLITDIHVTHRYGGLAYIPQLSPGENIGRTLRPSRDCNLRISYFNSQKHIKISELDCYVGPHNRSSLIIIIKHDGSAAIQQ